MESADRLNGSERRERKNQNSAGDQNGSVAYAPDPKRSCTESSLPSGGDKSRWLDKRGPIAPLTRPPTRACITVTSMAGRRMYVPLEAHLHTSSGNLYTNSTTLLSTPVEQMLHELREKNANILVDSLCTGDSSKARPAESTLASGEGLWVDRYSPRCFTELLSEERVNREILSWLKSWDSVVHEKGVSNDGQRSASSAAQTFPEPKAILLCGPPGYGKTTLARVLACQAGYNPVEINASSVRTMKDFVKAVEDAVQFRSVFVTKPGGSDTVRPNCLVIDEIDGISGSDGKGAVDFLLRLVSADSTSHRRGESEESERREEGDKTSVTATKGRRRASERSRYVPVLRQLRQHLAVYNIGRPKLQRLSERLKHICRCEHLPVDSGAIVTACERAENDVRSILNALQFLKARRTKLCSETLIEALVGQKDISRNIFFVLDTLFSNSRPTAVSRSVAIQPINSKSVPHRSEIVDIFDILRACGDLDKIIDGCWENFLSACHSDHFLIKATNCLDWLLFFDLLSTKAKSHQANDLFGYLNIPAAAFHFFCKTPNKKKFGFPKLHGDMWRRRQQLASISKSFLEGLAPLVRVSLSERVLSMELASFLVTLLNPTIRTINTTVMSAVEKQTLETLVDTYLHYGLSYKEVFSYDGRPDALLEPTLDKLLPSTPASRRLLNYSQKKFIASELRTEGVRRAFQKRRRNSKADDCSLEGKRQPVGDNTNNVRDSGSDVMSSSDRLIGLVPKSEFSEGIVRFKYHEGYTNAVRRKVFVRDWN